MAGIFEAASVTVMPTTMLPRLVLLPTRLLTVVLPLVVLPARLKISGVLEPAAVVVAESGRVVPPLTYVAETVVGGDEGIPLPWTTIPAAIPLALATVTEVAPLTQVPVVLNVAGRCRGCSCCRWWVRPPESCC